MNNNLIYVITGETSGDMHAAEVVKELKKKSPQLQFKGVCGDLGQKAGIEPVADISQLSVMGFWEVFVKLYKISNLIKLLSDKINQDKPAVVLFVDFSEFNFKLASNLRTCETSSKLIKYVSPQVWASRSGRIKKIAATYDALLCILPFEKKWYDGYSFDVRYVGHPLLDEYELKSSKEDFFTKHNLSLDKKTIAIFPGSRKQEVTKHMSILNKTVKSLLQRRSDLQFILCKSSGLENLGKTYPLVKVIDSSWQWDIMEHSDFILTKSGTVTLQAAITETPAVIFYKMNRLTFEIGKRIVKVTMIGLPNIIANELIYKELIQSDFNEKQLTEITLEYLENEDKYTETVEKLKKVRKLIGDKGASSKVAETVLEYRDKVINT